MVVLAVMQRTKLCTNEPYFKMLLYPRKMLKICMVACFPQCFSECIANFRIYYTSVKHSIYMFHLVYQVNARARESSHTYTKANGKPLATFQCHMREESKAQPESKTTEITMPTVVVIRLICSKQYMLSAFSIAFQIR